uniref:Putative secreted protein n=1 Tax=Ixodes scapularis TaxID=6945 RepID=A0A4D5RZ08_IXOSC
MARARPPLSYRRRRQRWGLPLLLLSTPRNMAVLEASISSAASTSAVVKRGRPRQYTADKLRERKNDIHAFACTTRKNCLLVLPLKTTSHGCLSFFF